MIQHGMYHEIQIEAPSCLAIEKMLRVLKGDPCISSLVAIHVSITQLHPLQR